jgi:hypothetical protein
MKAANKAAISYHFVLLKLCGLKRTGFFGLQA